VVMTITAPPDSDYWRATTLDVFTDDRWIERLDVRFQSDERQTLHHEELTPSAAASIGRWVRADVRVEALRDRHLVGGSMPVAFDPGDAGTVSYLTGNVAIAQEALERADDYTVWSYVPRPTPAQLDRARHTRVQQGLARYLEVAPGVAAPLFGTPRRGTALRRLFADRELRPYERLYREARRVVGRPKSAYAAVVALEAWFRSEGGFVYEEQPDLAPDTPPLVDFVARTQEGYCQQFAGAMALMLRYLGIPARIGAGFTSGTYDRQKGQWTVTDHNAHTWVEVWFPRYGWLPFDPTPARGALSGSYTTSSRGFNASEAATVLGAGIFEGSRASGFAAELARKYARGQSGFGDRDRPGDYGIALPSGPGPPGASLLRLLALVAATVMAALALLKLAVRRSRYLTRDPRRLAAAYRHEFVEFLADQGVALPPSATLGEAGALVDQRLAVDTRQFVRAASRARFAPLDEAHHAAGDARRELRRVLRRIRRRVGIRGRLRGTLSVRSLSLSSPQSEQN
jgi:transglutaminase-like putative cysteine protease